MRTKDLELLEYSKFLEKLADFSLNEKTKEYIHNLKPTSNYEQIRKIQQQTQEFLEIFNKEGFFPLSEYPNLENTLKLLYIEESILSAKEILEIKNLLSISRQIKKFLSPYIKHTTYIYPLYKNLFSSRELEKIIDDSIDKFGMIKDSASKDLSTIRNNIKKLENRITLILEDILTSSRYTDIIQDKIITQRKERFVIPVKQTFSSKLKGIIHDRSSSGQTLFVEPENIINLNNKLTDLKLKEHLEIKKILKFLTNLFRGRYPQISKTYHAIVDFDLLYTKAKFAKKYRAIFPQISEEISLKEAKHPLFLLDNRNFIPIDIKIPHKRKGLVITGPNTGGKTVALKTLGLLSLLNQTGIPIPVEENSKLPIFTGIYADIGDMQSIEQNLSTYSAHIKNIKDILNHTDDKSLVLLDELIPGTDPDEGSAIGIGILENLKEKKAYILATSHFKQIKIYALSQEYFEIASVGFDKKNLSPTYKIHYKSIGESMAFYIAKNLGIEQKVLDIAQKYLDKDSIKLDKAVKILETYQKEYQQEQVKLKKLTEQLQKEIARYENLTKELQQKKKEKWKTELQKAEEFLKQLQKEGQSIIEKIKTTASGKDLEKFLKEKKGEIKELLPPEDTHIKEPLLTVGDLVKLKGKGSTGEILLIKDNKAYIEFNGIKLWAKLSDLTKVNPPSTKKKTKFVISKKRNYVKPEIKLIGKTKEEAIRELAKYLDKAVTEGIPTVRIIHGYGSGILRKAIREYLDRTPYNISYEDAPYHEGGMGVTIAHLR
ncbi:MAG: endonuclease MutS2 [Aquificae bacterium]|nr:endonuclease MutS2 [Aquificota bacterium]